MSAKALFLLSFQTKQWSQYHPRYQRIAEREPAIINKRKMSHIHDIWPPDLNSDKKQAKSRFRLKIEVKST